MNEKNERVKPELIPPHGGYRNLKSYQAAEIVYDATAATGKTIYGRRRIHGKTFSGAPTG